MTAQEAQPAAVAELPAAVRADPLATATPVVAEPQMLRWVRRGVVAGVIAVAAMLPFFASRFWLNVALFVTIAAIGGLGLNVLSGYTGQVSLGHAFFLAIGAYTGGVLGYDHKVDALLWLPAAGVVAAGFGLIVGPTALRLRGLYLSIVTIGLVFIGQHIWSNVDWLAGGPAGRFFPALVVGGVDTARQQTVAGVALSTDAMDFYVAAVVLGLCMVFVHNVARTRLGRAMQAVREREIAAAIMGVDLARTKLSAFVISSFITGLAGGLYGVALGYAVPGTWDLVLSIEFVAIIIVGGVGTVWGALLGALFIGALPKVLDQYADSLPFIHGGATGSGLAAGDAAAIAYGLLIVLFLLFEPHGVMGLVGRLWRAISRRLAGTTPTPPARPVANRTTVEESSA